MRYMKRLIQYILAFVFAWMIPSMVLAQAVEISWVATDGTGKKMTSSDAALNDLKDAPVEVTFKATPTDTDGWMPYYYEWKITHIPDQATTTRHDTDSTTYIFSKSGSYKITYTIIFSKDGEEDLEISNEDNPLDITIEDGQLTMPNAFSPNGDGVNDYYKPITCKSIVSFKAQIFNRWGKKVFEWNDPYSNGWDGTINGKQAPQGVYFCHVVAEGSNGRKYNIKRDVNLLRGYTESTINNR